MESVRLTSLKAFYFPLEMLVTLALGRLLTRVHPLHLMQRFYLLRISMALLLALFIHKLPGPFFRLSSCRCRAGADGGAVLSTDFPAHSPQ